MSGNAVLIRDYLLATPASTHIRHPSTYPGSIEDSHSTTICLPVHSIPASGFKHHVLFSYGYRVVWVEWNGAIRVKNVDHYLYYISFWNSCFNDRSLD